VTRYHVVGIGGAGMSAVARLLLAEGEVSGSDDGRWPLAEALRPLGATVYESFDPAHVRGAEVVVRSSAYGQDNVEVKAAAEAGIPLWRRHEAWAHLAKGKLVVAIAGTHGKTTTTAMTWCAYRAGGVDASLICGAPLRDIGANAHVGRSKPGPVEPGSGFHGDVLVIEADEYDRTFLALGPLVGVVTNVEHDHVDQFPTLADVQGAFAEFESGITGVLVACADDPGAAALAERRRERGKHGILLYGTSPAADARITDVREDGRLTRFTLAGISPTPLAVAIRVPGMHNVRNATAALCAVRALGPEGNAMVAGVESFDGTSRRLETVGEAAGVEVVDDYAHHPTEIRASLAAVRPRASRVIVVFQAHTPSRLSAFFDDFVAALRGADAVVIADTFRSARERSDEGAGARRLAAALGARFAADAEAAAREAASLARPGDLVLVMGAGDIGAAAPRILELLRAGVVSGGARS